MSMTREEAIEALQKFVNGYEKNIYGEAVRQNGFVQAIKVVISALRPITREQVEKVFTGCQSCKSCRSCVFSIHQMRDQPCKKCDPNAECALTEYKPSNFCPICGKPLTNEAVQMVTERLEALHGET